MAYDDTDIDGDDEALEGQSAADAEMLQLSLDQFDDIIVAVQEERALALSDRRFVSIAGAQWEGDWAAQFENSIMVEVNKTAQGVEKIITDYRSNRMIVDFRAVGKDASEHTAETLNGLFRADLYKSKGQQGADNAFEEAVQGGMGAWRLCPAYEDDYDPDNDSQVIRFEAIVDADQSVFWDPNAKLYDKSDATYCFVLTAMARGAFEKAYKGKCSDWPQSIQKVYYDWYTPDVVMIAEKYYHEETTQLRRYLRNKASGEERQEWASDLSPDDLRQLRVEGWVQDRTRKVKRLRIMKVVLSGAEVLERPKVIAGDCIPVVPVYGKRWFIDNMERSRGHVRLAKDPQRIYNAQISKLTELSALAPSERPVFTPEQIAGHETTWAAANINRAPYALINPTVNPDGSVTNAGPVAMIKPPDIPPATVGLIQITASDISELTSADDGADEAKANISAEAMDIAATRTDAKSGIYTDNMCQSWQRCGEIYLGMAREVYFEEGREVETMGEDGEDGTAILSEPFTDEQGRYQIRNDLARGKYRVISDVTEATATRRDKTVKTLVNVAQIAAASGDMDLASVCLATSLINMDGEGMHDLQDYVRANLVTKGAVKPTPDEKKQLEDAQQNQQPDPQAQALAAQADALKASAAKDVALAGKADADTKLSEAKRVQALADAARLNADAGRTHAETQATRLTTAHAPAEHRVGIMERLAGMFGGASA